MDNRSEVREFLMSRRARVEPEMAGLPRVGDRRVSGLRRSEAATLAGVSVEYYARLERGAIAGASSAVLDGLAKALLMDDASALDASGNKPVAMDLSGFVLPMIQASEQELAAHEVVLKQIDKDSKGKTVWRVLEPAAAA